MKKRFTEEQIIPCAGCAVMAIKWGGDMVFISEASIGEPAGIAGRSASIGSSVLPA